MSSTANTASDSFKWQNVNQLPTLDANQLENIKSHLDLILLALEAIANISSEAILQVAKDLNLQSDFSDRLTLWRLRSSNPQNQSSGGRNKLDVEEARSFVLVICYLAKRHQELLRRAVSLLEQTTAENKPPSEVALLGNYLEQFINYYQTRINNPSNISATFLTQLAWKLLIDLLFYSSDNSERLLWLAIFDAAQSSAKK